MTSHMSLLISWSGAPVCQRNFVFKVFKKNLIFLNTQIYCDKIIVVTCSFSQPNLQSPKIETTKIASSREKKLSMKQLQKIHVIKCTWYTAAYSLHQGFDILFTYLQSPGNPVVRCPYNWRYCCIFSYTPRFRL